MAEKFDAIVVGSGLAGMGAAALLQRGGLNTLLVEREAKPGGRTEYFELEGGWQIDIGLHLLELGDGSALHRMIKAAGKEAQWAKFSETVGVYQNGKWNTLEEMLSVSEMDVAEIKTLMKRIGTMEDAEIESNDLIGWGDWLADNVKSPVVKHLFEVNGMIMTTVPDPMEMSGGECLFIARDSLQKKRQFLSAAYPVGGMKGVVDPLIEAFKEAGGTLACSTTVDSVIVEDRKVKGVAIKKKSMSPYAARWYMDDTEMIEAPVVLCALPLWDLGNILDVNPKTSPLPLWWIKRYEDLKMETTGLIGHVIGLKEPVYDKPNFLSVLELEQAKRPFQAFSPTAFDPGVAPEGKSILATDCVVEPEEIFDTFELNRLLKLMWEDTKVMFPGIDDKVEFVFPYKCVGCDGLARKPGQVGKYKPDVVAPAVQGLFFAGDTYQGRGLAVNGASRSGHHCAEVILEKYGK